jgi:citrate synthase
MLRGEKPSERDARIFDVCLILHADHELNASTFTARVVAGTLADMYAAVTAAIGALSGPLHGGANTNVMKTLLEIGAVANVEPFIKKALADKRKIMGFGHAVYKTEDPRATHLRQFSKEMGEAAGDSKWYEMSRKVEAVMMSEKGLYPNVDFFSASTYYMMGIPLDLYTPIFAVSRISGWTGHILEQYADNKLIRPRAEYVGARDLPFVPIAERCFTWIAIASGDVLVENSVLSVRARTDDNSPALERWEQVHRSMMIFCLALFEIFVSGISSRCRRARCG